LDIVTRDKVDLSLSFSSIMDHQVFKDFWAGKDGRVPRRIRAPNL